MIADDELHRHAIENFERADALLFGRVIYEMMEAAWRLPAALGTWPDWMEPFARKIDVRLANVMDLRCSRRRR